MHCSSTINQQINSKVINTGSVRRHITLNFKPLKKIKFRCGLVQHADT